MECNMNMWYNLVKQIIHNFNQWFLEKYVGSLNCMWNVYGYMISINKLIAIQNKANK